MDSTDSNRGRPAGWGLVRAIRHGEIDTVAALLESGYEANNEYAMSPLGAAAGRGEREIAELLIAHGADVTWTHRVTGWTALTIADANDFDELADMLEVAGAPKQTRFAHGYTPFHRAARRGDTGARLQVAGNHTVDERDSADETPLMLAVRFRQGQTAAELIALGADPNAASGGPDDFPQWSVLAESAYQDAVGDQRTGFVDLLLAAGAGPNPPGYPPLFACINQEGSSAAVMRRLLDAGADPGAVSPGDGDSLVHRATQVGSPEVIEFVFSLGLSIEGRDRNGRTPLLAVVHQENPEAVRRLIKAGADIAAVDDDGASATDLAAHSPLATELRAALAGSARSSTHRRSAEGHG